jgi:alpha-ketoglutarate-dependent taurine dioxygenase
MGNSVDYVQNLCQPANGRWLRQRCCARGELAMSLMTRDIAPRIASQIHADKAQLLSGIHAAQIRELLEQRGVLVFPRINFTDAEQIEFTQTLGTFAAELRGEMVYKVTQDNSVNPQADYLKGSLYWHIDGTMNSVPILASLLSSRVLSPHGGDTEFCNTYAAYDALSAPDKQRLAELRVVHSAWNTLFYYEPEPSIQTLRSMMAIGERELPLVWTHRSGRKSLVLGCTAHHVVEMDFKKSAELLVELRDWATQPQFIYRHQWSVGDLVIWDNTGTMHRATPYDPKSGRLLHRTKLEGEEPFA